MGRPNPEAAGRTSSLSKQRWCGSLLAGLRYSRTRASVGSRRFPVALNAGRDGRPTVESPALVRALEPATAEAAEEDVLAVPEHDQVGHAIAVDVDRVGAGDAGEVGRGSLSLAKRRAPPVTLSFDRAPRSHFRRRGTGRVYRRRCSRGPRPLRRRRTRTAAVDVVDARGRSLLDKARRPRATAGPPLERPSVVTSGTSATRRSRGRLRR